MVGACLDPVEGAALRPVGQGLGALFYHRVAQLGIAGHHDVLGGVLLVGPGGRLYPLSGLHHALGVGHTGTHLEEHRGVELLGQLIGRLGEGQSLGRVGGLQHGQLGRAGVVAGVLLILGGVHPGVVGHSDNHTGVDAGIGDGEQGIGGHVEANVLHAAEGPLARQTGAEGGLHGHLLIGGPFGVHLGELGHRLGDLGAGGAWVAGDNGAARLIEAPGHGLVAEHQGFHGAFLLFQRLAENKKRPLHRMQRTTIFRRNGLYLVPFSQFERYNFITFRR